MQDSGRLLKCLVLLVAVTALAGYCLRSAGAMVNAGNNAANSTYLASAGGALGGVSVPISAARSPFQQRRTGRQGATSKPPAAKKDYSKFIHAPHIGQVAVPGKATKLAFDCANCHGVTMADSEVKVYPSRDLVRDPTKTVSNTHSACINCHRTEFFTVAKGKSGPAICLICHVKSGPTAKELRPFPNDKVETSDFSDLYSHSNHEGYSKKFAKTKSFECADCHTQEKMDKPGQTDAVPRHQECFVCHYDPKKVTRSKRTYAEKCAGCHAPLGSTQPDGRPAQPAIEFFTRQVTIPDPSPIPNSNPVAYREPFAHKDHDSKQYKSKLRLDTAGTALCLQCHTTALKAENRMDLLLMVDDKTKVETKLPPFLTCSGTKCHSNDAKGKVDLAKLDDSNCLVCHTKEVIKKFNGVTPAGHLVPRPPNPTPPPAVKPETTPAAKPTDKPAAKPDDKKPPTGEASSFFYMTAHRTDLLPGIN